MNLIIAINEENLEVTKNCCDMLNNLPFYSTGDLTNLLNINYRTQNYVNYVTNPCIDYVLDNLKINYIDEIKLFRKKTYLIEIADPYQIKSFVTEQLQNQSYDVDEQFFVQSLIELTVQLHDLNEIKILFNQINNHIKLNKQKE